VKLSTIIPAYRRHPLTVRAVEETLKSTRVPDEIIVVNDGGDPILKEMLPKGRGIIYARVEEDILWNYNGACNLGFYLSTGDVFVLQDTDHIPYRTAYENALQVLEEHPEVLRIGFRRSVVNIDEVMAKPMEEWTAIKGWGTNVMVTMMRREVYLKTKGQDEQLCGNYGWMGYDWMAKLKKLSVKTSTVNLFWAVVGDEGEPGMTRGLSLPNRRIYRNNAKDTHIHSGHGILNFHYEYQIL